MLVVMLVLLVATASAAVSLRTVQSEMAAAGHHRVAVQSQHAAEAAMLTTLAWMDVAAADNRLRDFIRNWNQAIDLRQELGVPVVAAGKGALTSMAQQRDRVTNAADLPALGPLTVGDELGSFGPNQAYDLSPDGYVMQITDCVDAPVGAPGVAIGQAGGSQVSRRSVCVVTARLVLQQNALTRDWNVGGVTYSQPMFGSRHDSRAIVMTGPEMTFVNQ